jgi:hypothetical protein
VRAPMTATVGAVLHVLGRSIVAGGDNAPVYDDDSSHPISHAIRAFAHRKSDSKKVAVRVGLIVCHQIRVPRAFLSTSPGFHIKLFIGVNSNVRSWLIRYIVPLLQEEERTN